MTRYADPTRCPDCGSSITPGASECPTCGLSLRGETAQELFTTLSHADHLLGLLRAGHRRRTRGDSGACASRERTRSPSYDGPAG